MPDRHVCKHTFGLWFKFDPTCNLLCLYYPRVLGLELRCIHVQAYVVTALQMFSLDAVNVAEFLEVYKGVVPPGEFSGMLDELTSGTNLFRHGSA